MTFWTFFTRPLSRHLKLVMAAAVALALAATHVAAQFGAFGAALEGELWGVEQELTLERDGVATGMAYVNGLLFVADQANETVVAYDSAGAVVPLAGAEWEGFMPGELVGATVSVDGGPDTQALLVSDADAHRVLAFDLAGSHLFTMALERPMFEGASGAVTGLAMGPGARFSVTTTGTPTLALEGSFAAGWSNQHETNGVVLAYRNLAIIDYDGTSFEPAPTATLDGIEGNTLARPGQVTFGLLFDPAGNLFVVDTNTERLNVYDPAFAHRFTFGTPAVDGTLEEFEQPYGMAYSPADGGRLFIGDSDHFRVQIYRPNLASNTLDYVSTIAAFGSDGRPRSVAIDEATGKLAVSGLHTGHLWILDRPNLAAFDVRIHDAAGNRVDEVCAGEPYGVRFSLTVPSGRGPVSGIVPQLAIDDHLVMAAATASATYSGSMTAGQVATYSYELEMPSVAPTAPFVLTAGAVASTPNVLAREILLQGVNCVGAAPTITATANIAPQISGWTPVRPHETFTLTFNAHDVEGVAAVEYQISGQNNLGTMLSPLPNLAPGTTQTLVLPLPEFGFSTITYRAHDTDNRKSPWQTFNLRSVDVRDQFAVEGDSPVFTVSFPMGEGYRFRAAGLPDGITINEATGQIGGSLTFSTAGTYRVTVTEDTGPDTPASSVSFGWIVANTNRHPQLTQLAGVALVEGQPFTLQIDALELDGDPTWYSMVGIGQNLPPGVSLDAATGVISGTFPFDSLRSYTIQISVIECGPIAPVPPCAAQVTGLGLGTVVSSTLNVLNFNRPPEIVNPGGRSNAGGDVISLPIVASDPDIATDGQVLTYRAHNLPPGLSIRPTTGEIVGTIGYNALPSYAVTIEVDDAETVPTRFVVFNWRVSNVNRPPVVMNPGNQTSAAGATVAVPISASDLDLQPLTYSSTGLPPGLSIGSLTGVIAGTIANNAVPSYSVTVRASDGTLFDEETFTWSTVKPNRPPVCSATAAADDLWPPNHKPHYLSLAGITDPDGDTITIRYTGILQDEPVDSVGQGNTPNFDAGIEDNGARAWVRSERTGNRNVSGDGRVYLISYRASDGVASCTGTTNLVLPHDQRGTAAVLSPGRWNSLNGQMVSAPPPAVNDAASVKKGKSSVR